MLFKSTASITSKLVYSNFAYPSPDHQSIYENHRVIAERRQELYRILLGHAFFALFPFFYCTVFLSFRIQNYLDSLFLINILHTLALLCTQFVHYKFNELFCYCEKIIVNFTAP